MSLSEFSDRTRRGFGSAPITHSEATDAGAALSGGVAAPVSNGRCAKSMVGYFVWKLTKEIGVVEVDHWPRFGGAEFLVR